MAELRSAGEVAVGRGLRAGLAQRLRVEWDSARATVRVYLDGALVARSDRAPLPSTDRRRIELRTFDPLSVRAIEVEGPLR